MVEVPVLSQKIEKDTQPGILNSKYIIQYRCTYRFPNTLKFDQLPMRSITDIAEYITFLIESHPDLLTKHPSAIDAYNTFNQVNPHVDPCLFDQAQTQPIRDELRVSKLMVNSFIPIAEMNGGKDWLVTIVWSIELMIQGSSLAYRKYFENVFSSTIGGNQINTLPGLTGGRLNTTPTQVKLRVYEDSPGKSTLAHKLI